MVKGLRGRVLGYGEQEMKFCTELVKGKKWWERGGERQSMADPICPWTDNWLKSVVQWQLLIGQCLVEVVPGLCGLRVVWKCCTTQRTTHAEEKAT